MDVLQVFTTQQDLLGPEKSTPEIIFMSKYSSTNTHFVFPYTAFVPLFLFLFKHSRLGSKVRLIFEQFFR